MPATTPDGFPYPLAADTVATYPVTGEALAQFLDDQWTPWTAYTPGTDNFTLGNGQVNGEYRRLFDTVEFRIFIYLGSTSDVTGLFGILYEAPGLASDDTHFAAPFGTFQWPIGHGQAKDASATAWHYGQFRGGAGGLGYVTYDTGTGNDTVPFTWTQNDILTICGSYRVAA